MFMCIHIYAMAHTHTCHILSVHVSLVVQKEKENKFLHVKIMRFVDKEGKGIDVKVRKKQQCEVSLKFLCSFFWAEGGGVRDELKSKNNNNNNNKGYMYRMSNRERITSVMNTS